MKPAKFDYYAPTELKEALDLLRQHGDEAKILAGGQSLVPMMNMRLARPAVVIDINRITSLDYLERAEDGGLKIGALTRQRTLERSSLVAEVNPLISEVVPYIGHFQIRNRGTVGGSIVHADPAAELPALCSLFQAQVVVGSSEGERVLTAEELYLTYFTTALEPTEMLTEVRFPALSPDWGWGFQEVARRHGDFAMVGALVLLQLNGDGTCRSVKITLFGVDGTPVRAVEAEEMLVGRRPDQGALEEMAGLVSEGLDPESDIHASAQYRKEVGGVLARRALTSAISRAEGGSGV